MFYNEPFDEKILETLKKYEEFHKNSSNKYSKHTSLGRFHNRLVSIILEKDNGYAEYQLWWLFHNCISHPILGILPCKQTVKLHQWASLKLNNLPTDRMKEADVPVIKNYKAWFKHNVLAHLAIGLAPCMKTFYYHDITAKEMNVDGWV